MGRSALATVPDRSTLVVTDPRCPSPFPFLPPPTPLPRLWPLALPRTSPDSQEHATATTAAGLPGSHHLVLGGRSLFGQGKGGGGVGGQCRGVLGGERGVTASISRDEASKNSGSWTETRHHGWKMLSGNELGWTLVQECDSIKSFLYIHKFQLFTGQIKQTEDQKKKKIMVLQLLDRSSAEGAGVAYTVSW